MKQFTKGVGNCNIVSLMKVLDDLIEQGNTIHQVIEMPKNNTNYTNTRDYLIIVNSGSNTPFTELP